MNLVTVGREASLIRAFPGQGDFILRHQSGAGLPVGGMWTSASLIMIARPGNQVIAFGS